mmetsp:Transcript_25629/g.38463  ORF Transcript_25629/g.38463 Transcript_25629/m.38463 type:complete len:150 (+) Transcript_25629:135-584(+)
MKQAKPRASISLFGGGADAAAEKERKKRAAEAEKAMKQAKPRASISIFGFGADASGEEERKKRAAEAEKAMKQAKPRASISLFGGTSKVEPGEAIAPRGVPTIVRWRKRGDGEILLLNALKHCQILLINIISSFVLFSQQRTDYHFFAS